MLKISVFTILLLGASAFSSQSSFAQADDVPVLPGLSLSQESGDAGASAEFAGDVDTQAVISTEANQDESAEDIVDGEVESSQSDPLARFRAGSDAQRDRIFASPNQRLEPEGSSIPDFGFEDPVGLNDQADFTYERTQEELMEDARRQAYDNALNSLFPLRPEEIRTLLERFDRTQESIDVPVYPAPKPEMVVRNISLEPGATPQTIKLSYGHVTTLSLLDMTGEPFPIEDISWAGEFEVTETSSGEGGHIVRITPQSEYATGNMSIRLLTLQTPVIIMLNTNRDIVHYRFDAVIPAYGPYAKAPLIDTNGISTVAGSTLLSSILQGIPPETGERLAVSGTDGRTTAYKLGGKTYLRTPLTLLSPSWSSSVSSADGMHVYVVEDSPVLLLSDKGRMARVRLSERGDFWNDDK